MARPKKDSELDVQTIVNATNELDPTLQVADAVSRAITGFNVDNGKQWTFGTNWDASGSDFETFTNKYLFPKLNETAIVNVALGNRFDWLAVETDFVGQYSEEYVILDTVPTELALDKSTTLMLERNYPSIATKLYGSGIVRKMKFTLNDNIARQQFATIGDAVSYAVNVYKKQISMINVIEEQEIKSMIMDYALNQVADTRETDTDNFIDDLYTAMLNLQNNSPKHNEAGKASGGSLSTFTTQSQLKDLMIVTTDRQKVKILNSFIAQSFNTAGLDLTDHIISFEDLGGAYKVKANLKVTQPEFVKLLNQHGLYDFKLNDSFIKGQVVAIPNLESLFKQAYASTATFSTFFEEIKPKDDDLFTVVLDARAIRYKRYTKNMLKQPFYNGEFDEVTYWIHYYSMKSISPFYNKVVLKKKKVATGSE